MIQVIIQDYLTLLYPILEISLGLSSIEFLANLIFFMWVRFKYGLV